MADVEEMWIADLRREMARQYRMGLADGQAPIRALKASDYRQAAEMVECGSTPGALAAWERLARITEPARMEGESDAE